VVPVALFKYAISISEKYKTRPTRSSLNCAKAVTGQLGVAGNRGCVRGVSRG